MFLLTPSLFPITIFNADVLSCRRTRRKQRYQRQRLSRKWWKYNHCYPWIIWNYQSDRNTSNSDITASSEFGIDGNFTLDLQAVNPENGLIELPENLTDAADQIIAGCPRDEEARFIISGRGGIPQNPGQVLLGEVVLQDLRDTANNVKAASQGSATNLSFNNHKKIVEATGWIVNKDGDVEFVADNNQVDAKQCNSVY